jgi:hypothetical protein
MAQIWEAVQVSEHELVQTTEHWSEPGLVQTTEYWLEPETELR